MSDLSQTRRKRVLITGTSSGFGFDLVRAFLERGWIVIATLRNLEERRYLFNDQSRTYGERLILRELDVTNGSHQDALAQEFGDLDLLINNAGFGIYGAFEDIDESQIREQFETNVFAVMNLTRKLLPALRKSKGRLIVVSSVAGRIGVPLSSLYCASKFALEGWAESLWYEVKDLGVAVTLIEPGRFRTSFSRNIVLGSGASHQESPYLAMNEGFRKFLEKRKNINGIDPREVIEKTILASESDAPPLRVVCGLDARMGILLKAIVPLRLFLALLAWVFSRKMIQNS